MQSETPTPEASPDPKGRLLQLLGVGFGLAGAVGGTLGAGILRTPGLVADQLGSAELVLAAWLVGGLYALLGTVCVAELATSLPRAGGWTVYAQRAFGPAVGFSVGWIDWLGHCAGLAWVAITIGEYTTALLPELPLSPRATALVVVILFSLVQLFGVQAGSGTLQLLSLVKALAFLVLVGAFFVLDAPAEDLLVPARDLLAPNAFSSMAELHQAGPPLVQVPPIASVVVALQAVITTFDGWHSPIYFAEEFSEPERDLPRSLIGGVLVIITIYLLVNLALLHVLPLEVIASSKLPVADAARLLFGGVSGKFITALVLISLLGLINASIMAAPRILYGLARDGLFSERVAGVSPRGTPVAAQALTALAVSGLVICAGFQVLLGIASFLYVALYLTGIVALVTLRWREPGLPRPFLVWTYPFPALVVLAGSAAFLLAACLNDSSTSLIAALLILVGLPLQRLAQQLEPDRTNQAEG